MRFNIGWASLTVGSYKFTVTALFYTLYLRAIFQEQAPGGGGGGAHIWRGDLTEGFLRYRIGGLIFKGAYFWNFTVAHVNC